MKTQKHYRTGETVNHDGPDPFGTFDYIAERELLTCPKGVLAREVSMRLDAEACSPKVPVENPRHTRRVVLIIRHFPRRSILKQAA